MRAFLAEVLRKVIASESAVEGLSVRLFRRVGRLATAAPVVSVLLVPAVVAPVHAELISYEGFGYTANTPVNIRNGGIGWQSAWSGPGTVVAPGRIFPGLVTAGNALRAAGNNVASVRSFTTAGFAGLRTNGRFGLDGTELWLSFLARRDTNFTTADFAGLTLADGGSQELFVGCVAGASRWSLQLFDLGTAPSNITPAADAPLVTGETALLVLRMQFGVRGTQDRVELFVNPPPGVTPTTPDATRSGADIRFNQVRLQSGPSTTAAMSFDELRLGESFADVAPTAAGPALGWLRDDPQRVTAGAELTVPLHHNWPDGDATTLSLAVAAADGALLPPDRIAVTGTGANRRVTCRPPAGAGGTTAITATLTLPGGAAVNASFDLTIGPTPTEVLLAYEGFDYMPVNTPLLQKNGGFGFAGSWSTGVQGAFGSTAIMGADSLPYPGLATQGLHARVPNPGNHGVLRATALPLGEDGTVRYLSFLARPDALGTAYLGLRLIGSAGADLFAGKPGGGSTLRYVLENAGGTGQSPTTKAVRLNTVALLVLKMEFRAGLDRVSLYVDPPLVGAEPIIADAVKTDLDLGLVAAVAFNSSPAWAADELRVGTTFAAVTRPGLDFALKPITSSFFVLEERLFSLPIETLAPLPAGRTLRYELVGDSFGAQIDAATGMFTWLPDEREGLPNGGPPRTFTVRATSNATPPQSDEVRFRVRVSEVNVPPQIATIPELTVEEGTPFSYQIHVTDPDVPEQSPPPVFSLLGPTGLALSPAGLLTWAPTPAQLDRTFTYLVRVTDAAGARSEQVFTVVTRSRGISGPEIVVEQPAGVPLRDGTTSVDYGPVVFGLVTLYKDGKFIIKNTGDSNLTGVRITLGGTNASDFRVTASPSALIVPGGSSSFTVRFTPGKSGRRSATLQLASNDSDENPFEVGLMGFGDDFKDNNIDRCLFLWFRGFTIGAPPSPASSVQAVRQNLSDSVSLANFHALQALMSETAEGRRLTGLYWQHTAEVVRILFADPPLRDQALAVLTTFQPGVSALLAGKGQESIITQAMVDQLNVAWNGLEAKASPALKAALQQERARFDGFHQFATKGFSQWAELLALPVPTQPRVYLSSISRENGRFSVEVNDVPGVNLFLWRSPDLMTWEKVPNAGILRDGLSLLLSDPAPSAERAFYGVRP